MIPAAPEARLLWLNGPYGVGKTTAGELLRTRFRALLFDPEHLGVALAELLPPRQGGDPDEDLPLWRSTVVHVGGELARTGTLVVFPATVYRPVAVHEMIDGFQRSGAEVAHVVLVAEAATIAARIHRGPRPDPVKQWSLGHLEPALAGLADAAHHLRLDTTGRTPCQVADGLFQALVGWGWLGAG